MTFKRRLTHEGTKNKDWKRGQKALQSMQGSSAWVYTERVRHLLKEYIEEKYQKYPHYLPFEGCGQIRRMMKNIQFSSR